MHSHEVMGKKHEKRSLFSVVTKISTHGGTLKKQVWNNLSYFSDVKGHEDFDYELQMAKNDVNKGHIVDFREILSKKSPVFYTKKIHRNFFDDFFIFF